MELLERPTNESRQSTENVGNFSGSVYSAGSRVSLDCRVRAVPVPLLEFSCKKTDSEGFLKIINCSEDLNGSVKQNVFHHTIIYSYKII